MNGKKPFALLVNPWIHDFSAYDFWMRPLGLLKLGGLLEANGFRVSLLDLLDRWHPGLRELPGRHRKEKAWGVGHFYSEMIPRPKVLEKIPRRYKRYGLPLSLAEWELARMERPDAILVGSMMTYWYPGVVEAIAHCRKRWPDVPIFAGGVYVDLLPDHARGVLGADRVFPGANPGELMEVLGNLHGTAFPVVEHAGPAYHLLRNRDPIPLQTSTGCPWRCTYCATPIRNPVFHQRPPDEVAEEVFRCHRDWGTQDFAFYDDALLFRSREHLFPILEAVLRAGVSVRFHTPNALHAALLDLETARLLRRANFKTIRLGLEYGDPETQAITGGKVQNEEYREAMAHLRESGFTSLEIGTYVLAGSPGQTLEAVRKTARLVIEQGSAVRLAHYSPIPGTVDWKRGFSDFRFDPSKDPLLTNDSLASFRSVLYRPEEYEAMKCEVLEMNRGVGE